MFESAQLCGGASELRKCIIHSLVDTSYSPVALDKVTHLDVLEYMLTYVKEGGGYFSFSSYESKITCISHLFTSRKFDRSVEFVS